MSNDSDVKRCSKCKEKKPFSEFYKDKSQKCGLNNRCKVCVRNYYRLHKGQIILRVKNYRETEKGKQVHLEASKKYRESHKTIIAKQRRAYYETLKGRLHCCFDGILRRCNVKTSKDYRYYGSRGICCLFDSFDEFYKYITVDLGYNTIEKLNGLELDRQDNNSHYVRGNIRFVSHKVNCQNRRNYPANRKRRGG